MSFILKVALTAFAGLFSTVRFQMSPEITCMRGLHLTELFSLQTCLSFLFMFSVSWMVLLGKAGGGFGVDGLEMAAKAGINTTKEIPAGR